MKRKLCVTVTAPTTADLRASATTSSAPTSSSCVSTRSPIRTSPRALDGRTRARDRHVPADVGRRTVQRVGRGAPADPVRRARPRRRVRRHRVARAASPISVADAAAAASCSRRTTSTACRRICPSARAPCGRQAPKSSSWRSRRRPVERLHAAARSRRRDRRASGSGPDRHGRARPRDARSGAEVRLGVDVRRRCSQAGRSGRRAAALLDEYRFRSLGDATRRLRARRIARSRIRCRRRCTTRRSARRAIDAVYLPLAAADADDFVTFARAFDLKGASVTIPFKVALFDRGGRGRCRRAAHRRDQHDSHRRAAAGSAATPTRAAFLEPLARSRVDCTARASQFSAPAARRAPSPSRSRRAAPTSPSTRATAAKAQGRRDDRPRQRSGDLPPAPGSWDVLVNCTPVGMHPNVDETPIAASNC